MKSIIIKGFKNRIDRVELIRLLVKHNKIIGIKIAKNNSDSLAFNGIPFQYQIDDKELDDLIRDLQNADIEFEIISTNTQQRV